MERSWWSWLTYIVEFIVEPTSVTNGLSVTITPPKSGLSGFAVGTRSSFSSGCALKWKEKKNLTSNKGNSRYFPPSFPSILVGVEEQPKISELSPSQIWVRERATNLVGTTIMPNRNGGDDGKNKKKKKKLGQLCPSLFQTTIPYNCSQNYTFLSKSRTPIFWVSAVLSNCWEDEQFSSQNYESNWQFPKVLPIVSFQVILCILSMIMWSPQQTQMQQMSQAHSIKLSVHFWVQLFNLEFLRFVLFLHFRLCLENNGNKGKFQWAKCAWSAIDSLTVLVSEVVWKTWNLISAALECGPANSICWGGSLRQLVW